MSKTSVGVFFWLFVACGCFVIAQDGPTVQLPAGLILGQMRVVNGKNLQAYLGIPYAQPPIGDLRFKAPQPFTGPYATSPYNAITFQPLCPQPVAPTWTSRPVSEDCLYLNVFAPVPNSPDEIFPVLFYIHGGSFYILTGDMNSYLRTEGANFTRMAVDERIVVVQVAYRLAALGFFSGSMMADEDTNNDRGSQGLLDQRLALQWVHDNIAAFGGDPLKVTIFGTSAGADSVFYHLVSPLNRQRRAEDRLFHRAILSSPILPLSLPQNNANDQVLVAGLGCTDMTCMRSQTFQAILANQRRPNVTGPLAIYPVVGSRYLPQQPYLLLAKMARRAKTANYFFPEVIAGCAHNDATIGVVKNWPTWETDPTVPSAEAAEQGFIQHVGADLYWSKLARYYSPTTGPLLSPRTAFLSFYSDAFTCDTVRILRYYGTLASTRAYQFARTDATNPWGFFMGAFHNEDVFFLGRNPDGLYITEFTPEEDALAATMIDYWGSFVRQGSAGLKAWPQFSAGGDESFKIFDVVPSVEPLTDLIGPYGGYQYFDRCAQWDHAYASFYNNPLYIAPVPHPASFASLKFKFKRFGQTELAK